MEEKKYNFKCGIKAVQKELTLKKRYELYKLFESVNVDLSKADFAAMKGMIELNINPEMAGKLLSIILTCEPVKGEPVKGSATEAPLLRQRRALPESAAGGERRVTDWGELTPGEYDEVLEDFFSLNPGASKLLMISRIESALMKKNMTSSNGGGSSEKNPSDLNQQ